MNYHTPVLLNESIDSLNIKEDGIYVDLTFGGGGHSSVILDKLTTGHLFAFDFDKDAEQNIIKDDKFTLIKHNYKYFYHYLLYYGIEKVDGILGDLGVSSYQLDAKGKGFSYKFDDASLDLRMNTNLETKAEDIINDYEEKELFIVFRNYGESKFARKIASAIVENRTNDRITKVETFKEILQVIIPERVFYKELSKIFQAIRIEINQELENLKIMLSQSINALKKGGRIAIISYHSLEDRLVKNYFKAGNFDGEIEKDFYGNTLSPLKIVNRKIITPTEEEIKQNKRARSAKLRIAEL